jgi:flagellar biosynthesis chaperone FliJ
VYDVGRYVNRIYERLGEIDTQLKEISDKFDERTAVNSKDISEIQEKMLTKSKFDEFVDTLRAKVEEKLPSLPESTSIISEKSKETLKPSTLSETSE